LFGVYILESSMSCQKQIKRLCLVKHEMRDPLKLGHRLVLGKSLNSISCQEYVMGICQVQQLLMLIFQTKLDVLSNNDLGGGQRTWHYG
jgi:hypothetical protein